MKVPLNLAATGLILAAFCPGVSSAQVQCPPEVASAKAILTARGGEMQASRTPDVQPTQGRAGQADRNQGAQASRSQGVQASRNQDVQAPRNQDVQAPRNQDVQAPRNQDVQAPRTQDVQAPRPDAQAAHNPNGATSSSDAKKQAELLVRQAEAACEAGDPRQASEKAMAALNLLKQ